MSIKDDELTSREQLEMRNELLAAVGSFRRTSASRTQFIAGGVGLILVGAVVGGIAGFALNGRPTNVGPAATRNGTPSSIVPAQCTKYEDGITDNAPGGAGIVAAAASANLPPGVVLSPGVSVVASATKPGALEATVRICGEGVTRDDLVEAGNAIAAAIAVATPRSLATLTVEAWGPIDSDAIAADPNTPPIHTDYQSHDWSHPGQSPGAWWQ
jgi:hypothetical protein